MARRGKIARLPASLREDLNHRLLDGESAGKILPWLNTLPEVLKVLSAEFDGLKINDQNLSDWRQGGYQDWLRQRERITRTRELADYAGKQARAAGGGLAEGAQAIAAGKLLELLEAVDEATENAEGQKLPTDELVSIVSALTSLRTTEQNDVRLKQNEKRLSQKDEEIALEREKMMRLTPKLFLQFYKSQAALDIAGSDLPDSEKMERLGQLMFPETWKASETSK
ncbi:MAG: DUF3486 family protein [Patescibacteria group bacterium]|nr:DUF3486 family protein [Patescibacteria group bacterium]